ncbi:hypothetical protein ACIHJG_35420 [Streptomyces sp. NPDC052415]|uniref:hypothetical protein n=1 Tax=Streptomyces sp. NPDC052415 TaxID=3365690 RepID=UPI0037D3D9BB
MTTVSWGRTKRLAAASVLTLIAIVATVVFALGVGVPQAWWPHTGQAFAAETRAAGQDRCALIAGPARDYCERGAMATASAEQPGGASAAWGLVPAGAGVAALMVWRLRNAAGQRRH